MKIALISPSKNEYSETFIQVHKERLRGEIFHYYGGLNDKSLDGFGSISNSGNPFLFKIQRKFLKKDYTWYFQRFLKASLKKHKIDIVLAEFGYIAEQNLPVIRELKLPLIVHFHGLDASVYSIIKKHNNYKRIFEYARFIIAVSRKMYDDLKALGCPEEKLIYNVYGPREDFIKVDPQFTKNQFISIGRFVDKKAPYYLILSFKEVVVKYPEAKLIIAGEGNLLNTCKNLAKYYGLEQNIHFPGIITANEYRAYLSESLAMLQHSITAENGDSEGTPLAILEASAAGLPILATKHAGIPDVIIDGETGLLVEEHDVKGMAENMLKLLKNTNIVKELGENGKKNIAENYTLDKHIKILNDLILKTLKFSK